MGITLYTQTVDLVKLIYFLEHYPLPILICVRLSSFIAKVLIKIM